MPRLRPPPRTPSPRPRRARPARHPRRRTTPPNRQASERAPSPHRCPRAVRDRLIRTDGPAELLAALRVLHTESEGEAGDADRLEGERGEGASARARDDLRRGGGGRPGAGTVVGGGGAAEPPRRVDPVRDAGPRPGGIAPLA